jgi:hypothetical protein
MVDPRQRRGKMKGLLIVPVFGAALLAAGVAFASSAPYSGTLQGSGCGTQATCQVSLSASVKKGEVTKVVDFSAPSVPVLCNGMPGLSATVSAPKIPVKNGKFSFTEGSAPNEVQISGKFAKNLKKATGTLSATSQGVAGACDSGKLPFKVQPAD